MPTDERESNPPARGGEGKPNPGATGGLGLRWFAAAAVWWTGLATLAAYAFLVATPVGGTAGVAVAGLLALAAASAPIVHRTVGWSWTMEVGLALATGVVALLPLSLRPYRPRVVLLAGFALVLGGYALLRFAARLAEAWEDGGDAEGSGGLANAWRYGWTRIATVTAAAAATVLLLTQAPRLVGHLVSDRWVASVDATSVQALGVTVLVFLAGGTAVTLLRLGRAAGSPTPVEEEDSGAG
jgi:hypothetical protein